MAVFGHATWGPGTVFGLSLPGSSDAGWSGTEGNLEVVGRATSGMPAAQATGCESRWVVGRSKQRAEQSVHKHEVLRAPSWQPLADAGATIVRMCVYEARRGNPSRSEADVARFIVHVGESGRRPPSQANRRKAGNHRQLVAGG